MASLLYIIHRQRHTPLGVRAWTVDLVEQAPRSLCVVGAALAQRPKRACSTAECDNALSLTSLTVRAEKNGITTHGPGRSPTPTLCLPTLATVTTLYTQHPSPPDGNFVTPPVSTHRVHHPIITPATLHATLSTPTPKRSISSAPELL